jgi:hypothetical protein
MGRPLPSRDHPPYMGGAFLLLRYMENTKSANLLWMGCGQIELNPSTGWEMLFGRIQSHIQRDAGSAAPHLGVLGVSPQYPQPLLLLRISYIL